jgi:phage antirepressor YoqD-like protein
MSAETLNKFLHARGIIYRCQGAWVLYHQYQDKGYTGPKTFNYTSRHGEKKTSIQTYWTEKGREFIHGVVKLFNLNKVKMAVITAITWLVMNFDFILEMDLNV